MPVLRPGRLFLSLALFVSTAAVAAQGDVYKWRDEQGRMIYGDRPPQGVKAEKVEAQITTVPAQINTPLPPVRRSESAKANNAAGPAAPVTGAMRQQLIDTCVAAGGADCESLVNKAMEDAVKRSSEGSRAEGAQDQ